MKKSILIFIAIFAIAFGAMAQQNIKVPEMIFVKGGTFRMGSIDSEANGDEKPIHSVTVSDFYIGKYEVTNAEFCDFLNDYGDIKVKSGPYRGKLFIYEGDFWGAEKNGDKWIPASDYENYPVVEVRWYGANEYCRWLSRKTGQTYRLPTEAEWEYAARGGNKSRGYKYSGSNNIETVAWYDGNSGGEMHPVGTKSPNELGIYDMTGNVWEWCKDLYDDDYYERSPNNNPVCGSGSYRVRRGGGWNRYASNCRVALRDNSYPTLSYVPLGFRVARVAQQ